MATLVLTAVGSAIGSSVLGTAGVAIGQTLGGLAGRAIDQSLFGDKPKAVHGPRVSNVEVQASTEGAPIPRVYGWCKLSGQVIWATDIEEVVTHTQQSTGGGKGSPPKQDIYTYSYYANFAVALCEGEISHLGRIWANGKLLDQSDYQLRFYKGSETQQPDDYIASFEGEANTPAYRGTAYVVFERMPLAEFGNRLPQLSFELCRTFAKLEKQIKAVNIIPGSTEYGYDPVERVQLNGEGVHQTENLHSSLGRSDWTASIDQLQNLHPNLERVSLVVTWFGNDLRAGHCNLMPGVEGRTKRVKGDTWHVANLNTQTAHLISRYENKVAFGGTASDSALKRALRDLKNRGLKVTFYPFIMMDIPYDSNLPDPLDLTQRQGAYPWRGSITCEMESTGPSIDQQIENFLGPKNLSSDDWTFRRMILHYANLCKSVGVDTFLIGSEMRGLTTVRNAAGRYPFVDGLCELADEVRAILGQNSKISYAADWSEYFGTKDEDKPGSLYYHLDPLWSHPQVNFIGIDNYMPLADWRETSGHLDSLSGEELYDPHYLAKNFGAGEGYEWYYASDQDRQNQVRTPITDGAYQQDWVYRYKDLKNWWSNLHYDRDGLAVSDHPTAWVPESKPIWFTEYGCPAIHLGANQPNKFLDPKSIDSSAPFFSYGVRDDRMQRSYLEALYLYWDDSENEESSTADFLIGNNPISSIYNGSMLDISASHIWTWDARPYPDFPMRTDIWSDGINWQRGHWLNGRSGGGGINDLIIQIARDYELDQLFCNPLNFTAKGYVIDRPMSCRQALEPLLALGDCIAYEADNQIRIKTRHGKPIVHLSMDAILDFDDEPGTKFHWQQKSEIADRMVISFADHELDYKVVTAKAQLATSVNNRLEIMETGLVSCSDQTKQMVDLMLKRKWGGRLSVQFSLPMSFQGLELGDVIRLYTTEQEYNIEISKIEITDHLKIEAYSLEASQVKTRTQLTEPRAMTLAAVQRVGQPQIIAFETPFEGANAKPLAFKIAAFSEPWPTGGLTVYQQKPAASLQFLGHIEAPAVMGSLDKDLATGPSGRWDYANAIDVNLSHGEMLSYERLAVLNGENLLAIQTGTEDNNPDHWEFCQFQDAQLIDKKSYRLSKLLRSQGGRHHLLNKTISTGHKVILINDHLLDVTFSLDELERDVTLLIGPSRYSPDHESYVSYTITPRGLALMPLDPVHCHMQVDYPTQDLVFAWKRRVRSFHDNWALTNLPLNEDEELYEFKILNEHDIELRQLYPATPYLRYSHDDQVADFGEGQHKFTIQIRQISSILGGGNVKKSSFWLNL